MHARLLDALNARVQPHLLQLQAATGEDLNRIRSRESALQQQVAASASSLRTVALQHSAQQLLLQAARSRVASQMRDCDSLQSKLDLMNNEVARASSALSSQQPLDKLKRAMLQIKQETRALHVLVGVTAQLLQAGAARGGGGKDSPAADGLGSNDFDGI